MPRILSAFTLLTLLLASGCGQLGPLYEPEEEPTPTTTAPTPAA